MIDIDFYYDVVCPWAYLASTQIEAVADRIGARVRWRPILLGGVLRHVGTPDDPTEGQSAARVAIGRQDLLRWSDRLGVPLRFAPNHPRRSVDAMRLCCSAPEGPVRVAVTRALYAAYWQEGRDISDRSVLAEIAARHDLSADAITSAAMRAALRDATDAAIARGVFGVPTFVSGPHLTWGIDRLEAFARTLGAAVSVVPPLATKPAPSPTSVTFLHDFASPFSYLAATQIDRIAAEHGVRVTWAPILLGALFRDLGTPDVPLFAMNPTKQAWITADLERAAASFHVPFSFPRHFPMRSVLPLRAALVQPRAALPIYRAAWGEGLRVDTPETLADVLQRAGFVDAQEIVAGTDAPAIKAALFENTASARAAGACGVPTFAVERDGAKILLWGQDRLAMLADVLAGWWPPRG